jgi:riboflavin synthase
MFAGIVDAQGIVQSVQKKARRLQLWLRVPPAYRGLRNGSSVSVDGACLTVTGRRPGYLSFDVVPETLKRTRLGRLKAGERVNLERPLRWKGRIEGHFVQGHVDAVARIAKTEGKGRHRSFQLKFPSTLKKFVVEKGSVALNGVSLTVGRVRRGFFWVHIVPHTLKHTGLGAWKKGDLVNMEADLWLKAFDNRARGR